jgi:hypothetical protein
MFGNSDSNWNPEQEPLANGWKTPMETLDKFLLDLVRNGSHLTIL